MLYYIEPLWEHTLMRSRIYKRELSETRNMEDGMNIKHRGQIWKQRRTDLKHRDRKVFVDFGGDPNTEVFMQFFHLTGIKTTLHRLCLSVSLCLCLCVPLSLSLSLSLSLFHSLSFIFPRLAAAESLLLSVHLKSGSLSFPAPLCTQRKPSFPSLHSDRTLPSLIRRPCPQALRPRPETWQTPHDAWRFHSFPPKRGLRSLSFVYLDYRKCKPSCATL